MMGSLGLEMVVQAQSNAIFWQIVFVLALIGFFWSIGRWLRDGR
jgi:hypothetical protein